MAEKSAAENAADNIKSEAKFLAEYESFNKKVKGTFKDLKEATKQLGDLESKVAKQRLLYQKQLLNGQDELADHYKKILELDEKLLANQKKQINSATLIGSAYKTVELAITAALGGVLTKFWLDLNKIDASWKDLNKSIGLSGDRSLILRDSLISASSYAAKIGVSFEDLVKIQGTYTSQLGSAIILNQQNLKDLADLAAGTQMGAEQAGLMAAKFNQMGISIDRVKTFYEGVVNQSAKFGVSSDVVIKKINDGLDKSQQYVFKGGVEGLKNMALYATKFNLDMNSIFNAMDKSNSLEGAVDMAAKLQVIGGKFAQTDPFKLLYQARNDAEGFTKTMQGLTAGMATFNKTSGQIEITAGDFNRLKLAADATGLSYESLIAQAKKGAQISMIDNVIGNRMTKEQKEFVEGVAQIQKNGSFSVNLGTEGMKDLKDLSSAQVNALMKSTGTLNQRAKDAQTFDQLMVNTLNEFKSSLLPVLQTLDSVVTKLSDSGWLKPIMYLGTGIAGLIALKSTADTAISGWNFIKPFLGKGTIKNITEGVTGNVGKVGSDIGNSAEGTSQLGSEMSNTGNIAESAAVKMLAFGAAVIEIGAGIWIATKGISAMADAFKGLDKDQLIGINVGLLTLVGGIAGIAAIGAFAGVAAPELLIFGGAILAIGTGIGIAAAGIGYMAKSFGSLFDSIAKVSNDKVIADLGSLVLSLSALGVSSLLFSNPLAWIGLTILTNSVGNLADKISSANFEGLNGAATSFNQIASAIESINDKKLDKLLELSESFNTLNTLAGLFTNFSNILGDGLKVQIDQIVPLHQDITVNLDGDTVARTLSRKIPLHIESDKNGKKS